MDVLKAFDETVEEFGITGDKASPVEAQVRFVREQANQMKAICVRLLFDITTTKMHLAEDGDENTKNAYNQKLSQYKTDLRQTSKSLDHSLALLHALEAKLED